MKDSIKSLQRKEDRKLRLCQSPLNL